MKKFTLKDAPKGEGWTAARRRAWLASANKALEAGKSREEVLASEVLRTRAKATEDDEADADVADSKADSADAEAAADKDDEDDLRALITAGWLKKVVVMPRTCARAMSMNAVPKTFDKAARTVDAVVSVGAPVERYDYWTDSKYLEVLDMNPGSIRLDRLNGGAQLLNGHNAWGGLDAIIGAVVPGSAHVQSGELRCTFQLSESEHGQRVAQDLANGIPFLLSTGYKTHQERINSTTNPQTRTATDWEPLEVSIVPVNAEGAATGFRSLPSEPRGSSMKTEAEIRAEIEAENKRKADEAAAALAATQEAERKRSEDLARAATVERTRIAEIMEACRGSGMTPEFTEKLVKDGTLIEACRTLIIAELAKRSKDGAISGANGNNDLLTGRFDPVSGRVVRDELEGAHDAMAEALAIRMMSARRDAPGILTEEQAEWCRNRGVVDMVALSRRIYDGHEKPRNDRTKEYLRMSLVEIAAACIGWKRNILPGNIDEIFARAYSTRQFHSTGDFANLFENAMNKTLLGRYQLAAPTYRMLAIQRNFVDFRPHNQYRAGEFPTLLELTETGEIKGGTAVDSKEVVSIKPYGRQYGVSRQAMVNDDMGAIDQILSSIGDIVTVFENNAFFAMLASNPVLVSDSIAVFDSATHKNYTTPGGNPSIATVSDARKAMRVQTSLGGNVMNVTARIMLAGPAQETKVDQLLATISPALTTSVNPFSGKMTPVNDANITGDEWYIFADPSQVPNFVYGFLNGSTGPRIRTDDPFGFQGVKFSVEHDFGCGAIDFRGAYKNAGVGPSG